MAIRKIIGFYLLIVGISFCLLNNAKAQGFLHANGKKIVNDNGEVILRGIGLGGWMLQEGYMLHTETFADAQFQIRKKIEDLIGIPNTDTFYTAWLKNHMCQADIDSAASFGFNSVRLPMHYNLFTLPIQDENPGENTWLDIGFEMVDSLLAWCREKEIYLILDLHAAPGGQSTGGICDYDNTKPSLWTSQANRSKAVALWGKLAQRYANEEWIGGYDLLNETNWTLPNNTMLKDLFVQITDTIRKYDSNHIIFIEGNSYANDFTGLTPPWDDNMAYSFHKYSTKNDQASIQWMLNIRNSFNIPLWCGESGENSNSWYTDAIKLFEKNDIGWSWWPWKKFESISGMISVVETQDYKTLLNYWKGIGPKPDILFAKNTLMQMTENLKIENCIVNKNVIDAMFRQTVTDETLPFATYKIPGYLNASDYDYGRNGLAYFDTDTGNYQYSIGIWTGWNNGWVYRNDGVDVQTCTDTINSNGYNVGWTTPGEWMQYTVDNDSTAAYSLIMRYSGLNATTYMHFQSDSIDISEYIVLPSTGSWLTWDSLSIDNILLTKGAHSLRLYTDLGGCNISYFSFENPKASEDVPFKALTAHTNEDGTMIFLTLNRDIITPLLTQISDFILRINDEEVALQDIALSNNSNKVLIISPQNKIHYGDIGTIEYRGTSITSTNGLLEKFSGMIVINELPICYEIPGKIEAENYYYQWGLSLESCNEGGQNLSYIETNDYADYRVKILSAGDYSIDFRVAALNTSGSIELQLFDENNNKTVLGTYSFPVTGGWQLWKTKSVSASLPAGYYTLRVFVKNGGFNLNWLSFNSIVAILTQQKNNMYQIYPNPCSSYLNIVFPQNDEYLGIIKIIDSTGKSITTAELSTNNINNAYSLDVNRLNEGLYFMNIITVNKVITSKFIIKR